MTFIYKNKKYVAENGYIKGFDIKTGEMSFGVLEAYEDNTIENDKEKLIELIDLFERISNET